jgi:hypothetical protein
MKTGAVCKDSQTIDGRLVEQGYGMMEGSGSRENREGAKEK